LEEDLWKALATMALIVCKGQRFGVFQKNITAGGIVSPADIDLLVHWKGISLPQ
jgi:hypothetical protein